MRTDRLDYMLSVCVDRATNDDVERIVARDGTTISKLLREWIDDGLARDMRRHRRMSATLELQQ